MITIRGTSDHHHLESVITIGWNDRSPSLERAQWRRQIERARYDADLAERRYEAVDPGNRLIAGTLERRWNDAMQRLLELEAGLANFERQTLRTITADQKTANPAARVRFSSSLERSIDRCA